MLDKSKRFGLEHKIYNNITPRLKMRIKKCVVRLDYEDCESHYYIMDLDLDESIEEQIYDYFEHEAPTFTDFKWQEIQV